MSPLRSAPTALIHGGLLLTQDAACTTMTGDVLIVGGRIEAIGHIPPPEGATMIDASGMAVLPGFVDTHRHMWQSLFRLVGFGWDFPAYRKSVQLIWGPRMTPQDAYTAEMVSALSALDAGITTVRDEAHIQNTAEHAGALVAALQASGIRAVFAHGWPSVDSDAWMSGSTRRHPADITRVRHELLCDDTELVTLGAMLRGPEMADMEVTRHDVALARDLGVTASMHVGFGGAGIRQLHDAGLLGSDLLLVHCCDSSDEELRMLANAGAAASVAAGSESTMPGMGLPATTRLMAAGVSTSLSTDTEVCVAGDMFTQMRAAQAASVISAAQRGDNSALTAMQLLALATYGGAVALKLDDRIGRIAVGKDADLIAINLDAPHLAGAMDPAAAIVAAATPRDVEVVMVRGRVLKHSGLTHLDAAETMARARAAQLRIVTG